MKDSVLLKYFSTKALIQELIFREGVEAKQIEPYQDIKISVNGPAVVLVVTD